MAGAPGRSVGTHALQGAVLTFARSGGQARTQTATLTASDGAADDRLGYSVAIHGDAIVAGAPIAAVGAHDGQGAAYTFARAGAAARTETGKLTASDSAAGSDLGAAVAIDADTIVAGAPSEAVGTVAQGAVYTFARTGAVARTQTATLTASDGDEGASLGLAVAIDGDTIVAGAPSATVDANDRQGSVYTFARAGAPARRQTAKLTQSQGAAGGEFGSSVAIDGDTILAGAPDDDSASVFVPPPLAPPVAPAPAQSHASAPAQDRSSAAAPHAPGRPALSKLAVKPRTIHRAAVASSAAVRRARITFTLSGAASVELRFQRAQPGRAVGKTCAKPSRSNRGRPRCTRYVTVGRFTVQGRAGANASPFAGRRSARSLFPVGRYRLVATPTGASGDKGTPRTTTLRIVRR